MVNMRMEPTVRLNVIRVASPSNNTVSSLLHYIICNLPGTSTEYAKQILYLVCGDPFVWKVCGENFFFETSSCRTLETVYAVTHIFNYIRVINCLETPSKDGSDSYGFGSFYALCSIYSRKLSIMSRNSGDNPVGICSRGTADGF